MRQAKWACIYCLALVALVVSLGCCRSQPAIAEAASVQQIDFVIVTGVHQAPHYRLNATVIQFNEGGQYPADQFAGPSSPQLLAQFTDNLKSTGILDISQAVSTQEEVPAMENGITRTPALMSVDYADGRSLRYAVAWEGEIVAGTPFAAFYTWLKAFEQEARKRCDANTPRLDH